MAYTPTTWINDTAPFINATNLNKIETGIDEAHNSANIAFIQTGVSAVSSDVQSKLRESVSVGDFNAAGDGTTDDYAEFQAAMVAHTSVHVPTANYLIDTATVLFAANNGMTGNRQGSKLTGGNNLGNGGAVLRATSVSDVHVEGLRLSLPVTANQLRGFQAQGTARVTINGIHAESLTRGSYPLLFRNSNDHVQIVNSRFVTDAYGVLFKPAIGGGSGLTTNAMVIANDFEGATTLGSIGLSYDGDWIGVGAVGNVFENFADSAGTQEGFGFGIANDSLDVTRGRGAVVSSNIVNNVVRSAFHAEDNLRSISWVGNVALDSESGFEHTMVSGDPKGMCHVGNIIDTVDEYGISYTGASGSVEHAAIVGNSIRKWGEVLTTASAIFVGITSPREIVISNNVMLEGTGDGIRISASTGTAGHIIISGNTVECDGYALNIQGSTGPKVLVKSDNIFSRAAAGLLRSDTSRLAGDKHTVSQTFTANVAGKSLAFIADRAGFITDFRMLYIDLNDATVSSQIILKKSTAGTPATMIAGNTGIAADAALTTRQFATYTTKHFAAGDALYFECSPGSGDGTFTFQAIVEFFTYG